VTLLERDVLAAEEDPESAFATERRGAPQAHHTHGLLARLVVELRRRFPDVLDDLFAAGGWTMPVRSNLGEPRPGDEDLAVLILRRTTLEWALRAKARGEAGVDVLDATGVAGLTFDTGADTPAVTGVRLDDGTTRRATAVVVSAGRRSPLPAWLAPVGVDLVEEVHQTGLVYLTRWYRQPPDHLVELDPKIGGDLGFLKFLAVPTDGGACSITLAVPRGDDDLRAALADPERFDRAVRLLPGPARFLDHPAVEPIGPVRPMGGLVNRIRRFVDGDGQPLVTGLHAVGDAHTCTNPLYGRGCSLAFVQAGELVDAFAAHPRDPVARAVAFEGSCARTVEPWYHATVQMDAAGRAAEEARQANGEQAGGAADILTAVFAAAETNPVIARGLARMMHLLVLPEELYADPEFTAAIAPVIADPASVPRPPAPPGPSREQLLAA
jgi:2-polyprenyl-6-methoxyphenol hydroxylase-like FAD-dependent oxidoreductase